MTTLKFGSKFRKQYQKAPRNIQKAVDRRLGIFIIDSAQPVLNNHRLTGQFRGFRSININGDWRAIYHLEDSIVIFDLLGTHSQLYH